MLLPTLRNFLKTPEGRIDFRLIVQVWSQASSWQHMGSPVRGVSSRFLSQPYYTLSSGGNGSAVSVWTNPPGCRWTGFQPWWISTQTVIRDRCYFRKFQLHTNDVTWSQAASSWFPSACSSEAWVARLRLFTSKWQSQKAHPGLTVLTTTE